MSTQRRIRPLVDALELRQLLAISPVASTTSTFDIQLQPGIAGAWAQLMPLFNATDASVQPTSVTGLFEVQVSNANAAALAQGLSASPAVQYAEPMQLVHDATVPNDPKFTSGAQWGLNGAWGINAPTAWNTSTGSTAVDRRRYRYRHQLQPSRSD